MKRWCICYVTHTTFSDGRAGQISFGTRVHESAEHPVVTVKGWDEREQRISSGMPRSRRVSLLSFAEVGPEAPPCDWET
jgi:hypothetical protein